MTKRTLSVFMLSVMFMVISGCRKEHASPPNTGTQPAVQQTLAPQAKSELDRLNRQCANKTWQTEIDMIERPETRPENHRVSGEVSAFVSGCKESLAKQGVHVKWNPSKKLYEVDKTQWASRIEESWFPTVDGSFAKAEYIDLGKSDRLYIRYGPISDSGVELERVIDGNIVWRVHSKPLGVGHSKYRHEVHVRIDGPIIHINSQASGGNFHETRRLKTGELIQRTQEEAK